jgi:hypothetical protein
VGSVRASRFSLIALLATVGKGSFSLSNAGTAARPFPSSPQLSALDVNRPGQPAAMAERNNPAIVWAIDETRV